MPNHHSCLGHSTEQSLLTSLLTDLLFCQVTSRALRNPPPSIQTCSTIMTKTKSAFKSGLKQASRAHAQQGADPSTAQRSDTSKLTQNTSGAATDTLGSSASRASAVPPTKLLFGSLDRSLNRFRYKHRYFQNVTVDDAECTYDNRSLGAPKTKGGLSGLTI